MIFWVPKIFQALPFVSNIAHLRLDPLHHCYCSWWLSCSLGVFIATSIHHHQWNPGLHDSFNSVVSTAMEAAYSPRNYPGNICQIDVIPKSQRFSDKILNARYGEPLLIVSHRSPRERENYRLLPLPLVAFQNIEV